jgi:hypothetical protein
VSGGHGGQADGGSVAHGADGFQRHVAGALGDIGASLRAPGFVAPTPPPGTRPLCGYIQLENSARVCQAHSDQTSSRGCFSSPRHPYPLAAGSHPHRPLLRRTSYGFSRGPAILDTAPNRQPLQRRASASLAYNFVE